MDGEQEGLFNAIFLAQDTRFFACKMRHIPHNQHFLEKESCLKRKKTEYLLVVLNSPERTGNGENYGDGVSGVNVGVKVNVGVGEGVCVGVLVGV